MKAIIWDLDGTLMDSSADLATAVNRVRSQRGLPVLEHDFVCKAVGNGMAKLLERCFPELEAEALPEITSAFVSAYGACCTEQTAPYPGIEAVLAALSDAGIPMGIVTNKPLSFTQAILEARGVADYFAAVIGGDGVKKPAPDGVIEAISACAADIPDSWMVGDHHTDIQAGRAAGCKVCWVSWGIGHSDGLDVDAQADAVEDLLAILR